MKRTALPDVVTDEALNKFITGVLMNAHDDSGSLHASMGNAMIERTVDQLRAFFPGSYDVPTGGDGDGGNVQAWPKLAGSA